MAVSICKVEKYEKSKQFINLLANQSQLPLDYFLAKLDGTLVRVELDKLAFVF